MVNGQPSKYSHHCICLPLSDILLDASTIACAMPYSYGWQHSSVLFVDALVYARALQQARAKSIQEVLPNLLNRLAQNLRGHDSLLLAGSSEEIFLVANFGMLA